MSTSHATWKLSLDKSFNVVNEDGNVLIPWLYTDFTVEDMHRAVACWNAFYGIPTEDLPKGPIQLFKGKPVGDLATARTLLSDALETFDDNPREDHEVADRIRAFLKGTP